MDRFSHDVLFHGHLTITQALSGYRFTIDPVLLAHHIRPAPRDTIMDLGTGSGIIPLILAHRHPKIRIYGIEIQPELASLAHINVQKNALDHRVDIRCADMTDKTLRPSPRSMNWVVSNPPYIARKSGRLNPNTQKAMARHEISVTLDQVIETAHDLLKDLGRFTLIFPIERCDELIETLESRHLKPQTLRRIHPLEGGPAKRILVESVKHGSGPLTTLPPLTIFTKSNDYSDEVKNMFL